MALPSNTDHPSHGQDTPTPVSARRVPAAKTQFPRVPRFVILRRWQAAVWSVGYVLITTGAVYLFARLVTR